MLNIKELIEKAVKEKERFVTVRIEQMDGEIKLRIPFSKELDELREKHKGKYDDMMYDLIYNCCEEPRLNSDELLNHFQCKDIPYKVVEKVFGQGISESIANIILDEKSKENSVKILQNKADEIKNS